MDVFTLAYIEAALWSSTDESTPSGGEPLDKNYGINDIANETLAQMEADCAAFQSANEDDIDGDFKQAGHDFWLTRSGHGAGFWETSDWPDEEAGERLTKASKDFGTFDLYVGDDGLIHH